MLERLLATTVGVALALALVGIPARSAADASDDALAQGEKLYDQLCWTCHGRYGRGDGPIADQLSRRPPDFTLAALLAGRSDAEVVSSLNRASRQGRRHTPMAVSEVVSASAMQNAVAYMRTLAVPGEHVSVHAGRDVYQTFCWLCHGVKGDGTGPAAASLPGEKPRDFTSPKFVIAGREDEVRRTVAEGAADTIHGSEYMLEWGTKLLPQQVDDVVAYLKTFQQRGK
jgi:mono/diheme cytochrome c family protein